MICLTVDCEEWNSPLLRGKIVEENNNTKFSKVGNNALLDIFDKYGVKSTFFITGFFAEKEPEQVREIKQQGHEVASHGYLHHYRNNPNLKLYEDIMKSKEVLENLIKSKIIGFRSPQVQYSPNLIKTLDKLDFKYDSSLHPALIPGFYNNTQLPIHIFKPFKELKVKEIPIAVNPFTRLPVSWMFIRLFGIKRVIHACRMLLKKGITPNIYVHSWEFMKMKSKNVPFYFNYRAGKPFLNSIEKLFKHFNHEKFVPIKNLIR